MVDGKKSSLKKGSSTSEQQDRAMWWFAKEDDKVFVEKKKGRIKLGNVELGAVKSVLPSKTKPGILKVIIFIIKG